MVLKNFIAFEGIDGSGTTTQLALLRARFPSVLLTAEPTSSATGQFLRRMLSGEVEVAKQTAAYLFAADRCEHLWGKVSYHEGRLVTGVAEVCADGKTVVSDRYIFSSLAYQGERATRELTARLNETFPLPAVLVYFDISPELALDRVASRGRKREIYETLSTLNDVAHRYNELLVLYQDTAADHGMKVVKVNASLSPQELSDELSALLAPFLPREAVQL